MKPTADQLAAVAYLVHAVNPKWDRPGIESVLRRLPDVGLAQLAHAAISCAATRTDQVTPAVIAMSGPHWTGCGFEAPGSQLQRWHDKFADTEPASPERIAAIRAAAARRQEQTP